MYKIVLKKKVAKFLEKHKWENVYTQFFRAYSILKVNPLRNQLDIKSLTWDDKFYRLRISKYRFVFRVIRNEVIVEFFKADTRWDIYK